VRAVRGEEIGTRVGSVETALETAPAAAGG
jgi:hypothetical protein